jgi:beta-1,4-N-acetylglucosaminyltransferase
MFETVFVTVGTTKFDKLIQVTASEAFQSFLRDKFKTRRIVYQIGQGEITPNTQVPGVSVEWFRLRPDIYEVLKTADLVISHCGAGSIIDALKSKKILVAVVNTDLMNNHQMELADAMVQSGPYLFSVNSPNNLRQALEHFDFKCLVPFQGPNYDIFTQELLSFIDTK